jgi:hypothetical protein
VLLARSAVLTCFLSFLTLPLQLLQQGGTYAPPGRSSRHTDRKSDLIVNEVDTPAYRASGASNTSSSAGHSANAQLTAHNTITNTYLNRANTFTRTTTNTGFNRTDTFGSGLGAGSSSGRGSGGGAGGGGSSGDLLAPGNPQYDDEYWHGVGRPSHNASSYNSSNSLNAGSYESRKTNARTWSEWLGF